MKKIFFLILLVTTISCENKPTETNVISAPESNNTVVPPGTDTVNFTDANGLKQGRWIEPKNGVQSEGFYENGVLKSENKK